MRNLKKILALALVFAMTFTFASAASFTDQASIGADYVDDVNMLVELGVIAGYPDGSFGPQKNITRAEFAKMAYTLKYGSDADGALFAAQASAFVDVAADHWAKGYINYCYNQKIVSGVGNGKYNPNGNITVAEATKMILVILGCDPDKEGFKGANWMSNVTAKAIDLGVFDGWTGDPTQLATRELVAKFMRNAIFSPVYEYSAISGIGSQMDALGQNYNQTLGEKTMGLFHVEGIVVANERYALETDEEGEAISGISATNDEEESVIYYVVKDLTGEEYGYTITIDRGLADDYLGNKVDVYFKADATKDRTSGLVTGYKNIEVMGNVIVNSDTVAYTVNAVDVDVYPDGEVESNTKVAPYISFMVDGVEKQILADKDILKADLENGKLPKKEDAQKNEYVMDAFAAYSYTSTATTATDDADFVYNDKEFIADMGEKNLTKYRFVSVDGGKTYSYLFKMVADNERNASYGSVTNYSASKGSVTLSGIGTQDLEDCIINGELATDDAVVYYRENGKIVIEKVETVTGAVEGFTDDEGVIINGKTYYAWVDCEDINDGETLFDYYSDNKNAQNAGTVYYVYGNLIMEIEADEAVATIENYAVILRAYYDEDMDTAYVKLGFADNTEGTYKIGKYYMKKASEPNNAVNDRPQDFANNAFFGRVVKYSIRADGSVDLSGQYFQDDNSVIKYNNNISTEVGVYEEQFQDWDGKTYYGLNDATVVFALYGVPCYTAGGKIDATADGFSPIKAKAYKLNELKEINAKEIEDLCTGTASPASYKVASYVLNTKTGNAKYIVAAAMTVGSKLENISYKESRALAYVVSAMQRYNNATDKYYAEFTLINEDGLFTAKTIEDVTDLNANSALEDDYIGKLSAADGKYPAGTFLRYDINSENVLTAIDNTDLLKANISTELKYTGSVVSNGLYLINITSERNGVVSFFETNTDVDPISGALKSLKVHEDGYSVIGIDDGGYVGEVITKVSTRQTDLLEAGVGNAIVEVDEGQIVRIFSFIDGVSVN